MSATDGAAALALLLVDDGADPAGVGRLRASVDRHDRDGLPWLVVGPDDPALAPLLADLPAGLAPAARREAAVLAAVLATPTRHLLRLSAGTVLVRPFGAADLLTEGGAPYAFLTADRERRAAGVPAASSADRARRELGLAEAPSLSACGPLVYSGTEVAALLAAVGGTPSGALARMITAIPDADAWYAAWLSGGDLATLREPPFLVLGADGVPAGYSLREATSTDIARGYLGVVGGPPSPATDAWVLASAVPPGLLVRAAMLRAYRKAPRVARAVDRVLGRST